MKTTCGMKEAGTQWVCRASAQVPEAPSFPAPLGPLVNGVVRRNFSKLGEILYRFILVF